MRIGIGPSRLVESSFVRGRVLAPAVVMAAVAGVWAIAPSQALAGEAPHNSASPSISGKPKEGVNLTAKPGKWTGTAPIAYAYGWERCEPAHECREIPGATGSGATSTYKPVAKDVGEAIRVRVTATNATGFAVALSTETAAVAAVAPKNTSLPTISGSAQEGQLLEASPGAWTGTPPASWRYQWQRCTGKSCAAIATGASYRAEAKDVGQTLRVVVTDTNPAGTKTATSAATAVVTAGAPVSLSPPAIAGSTAVGQLLTASPGSWAGAAPISYTYTWRSCDAESNCTETTGPYYAITIADAGNTVAVSAHASNSIGSASASSAPSAVVTAPGGAVETWGENFYAGLGQIFKDAREERPLGVSGLSDVVEVADGFSETLALRSNGEVDAWGQNVHGELGDSGLKSNVEIGASWVKVNLPGPASAIAAADEHSLAIIGKGAHSRLYVWGVDGYGQFGNGTSGNSWTSTPQEVPLLEGVRSIAAGGGSDYAVMDNGTVMAWGSNTKGQLSPEGWPAGCESAKKCEEKYGKQYLCQTEVGPELCSNVPRPVVSEGHRLSGVKLISAGQDFAFAVLDDGEVLSWGNDLEAQLGQAPKVTPGLHATFIEPGPVRLAGNEPLGEVVEVSAGYSHALARLASGEVLGWGDNLKHELGSPAHEEFCSEHKEAACVESASPIEGVQQLKKQLEQGGEGFEVSSVAAGNKYSTAAIDHHVYTWGRNPDGELANGEAEGPETCLTIFEEEKWHEKEAAVEANHELTEQQKAREIRHIKQKLLNAGACSRTPLLVHQRGEEEGETGHTSAGAVLEHAASVAASQTHALVLLQPGAVQPGPIITVATEHEPRLALNFKWPTLRPTRLLTRIFEDPGEHSTEEVGGGAEGGSGGTGCESESGCGEESETACGEVACGELVQGDIGGSGSPHLVSVPHILHKFKIAKNEKPGVYRAGQQVVATEGVWTGQGPLTFTFQWELCEANGKCADLGAPRTCTELNTAEHHEGEKPSNECDQETLQTADMSQTIRATVTAHGTEASEAAIVSEETGLIRGADGKAAASDSVSCSRGECLGGFVLDEIELNKAPPTPIEEGVPYEFKVVVGGGETPEGKLNAEKAMKLVIKPGA